VPPAVILTVALPDQEGVFCDRPYAKKKECWKTGGRAVRGARPYRDLREGYTTPKNSPKGSRGKRERRKQEGGYLEAAWNCMEWETCLLSTKKTRCSADMVGGIHTVREGKRSPTVLLTKAKKLPGERVNGPAGSQGKVSRSD